MRNLRWLRVWRSMCHGHVDAPWREVGSRRTPVVLQCVGYFYRPKSEGWRVTRSIPFCFLFVPPDTANPSDYIETLFRLLEA
jgi:hypothetical protein